MTKLMLIFSLTLSLNATAAPMRTWTAKSGKTIKADFIAERKGNIILKGENGNEVAIPKNRLHEADQRYIDKTVILATIKKTKKPVILMQSPPLTWSISTAGNILITGKGKLPGSHKSNVSVSHSIKEVDKFMMTLEKAQAWNRNALDKKEAVDSRILINEIEDERIKDGLKIIFQSFADELNDSSKQLSEKEIDELSFLKVSVFAGIPFKEGLTQTGKLYGVLRFSQVEALLKRLYAAPFSELIAEQPPEEVKVIPRKKPVI